LSICAHRATIPTEPPDALTPDFAADEQKQREWRAFIETVAMKLSAKTALPEPIESI